MSLWQEIHEQPAAMERALALNTDRVLEVARWIEHVAPDWVLIAARGTSDNAARYAQYVWGSRNGLAVGLATPSLFSVYRTPPALEGAMVVGISQSGESPDLVAVLAAAREANRPTLAITNNPGSPLAAAADMCLPIEAGVEKAVAATKTYTAQLMAIARLSAALRGDHAHLYQVPEAVRLVLQRADAISDVVGGFTDTAPVVVLGRGFNLSTAFEWALKLQEMAGVAALPFSTADFAHGPLALASDTMAALVVAPGGAALAGVRDLVERLAGEFNVRTAVVSDRPEVLDIASAPLAVPGVPEWLSPMVTVVAAQLFTYRLATARGLDPDLPRAIRKVTRTT